MSGLRHIVATTFMSEVSGFVVCDDTCTDACPNCAPVNYQPLAASREATRRRRAGGSGRPEWWQGLGLDPDCIRGGGRTTSRVKIT